MLETFGEKQRNVPAECASSSNVQAMSGILVQQVESCTDDPIAYARQSAGASIISLIHIQPQNLDE